MKQATDTVHSNDINELYGELVTLLLKDSSDRQAANFLTFLVDGKIVDGATALSLYTAAVKEIYFRGVVP